MLELKQFDYQKGPGRIESREIFLVATGENNFEGLDLKYLDSRDIEELQKVIADLSKVISKDFPEYQNITFRQFTESVENAYGLVEIRANTQDPSKFAPLRNSINSFLRVYTPLSKRSYRRYASSKVR